MVSSGSGSSGSKGKGKGKGAQGVETALRWKQRTHFNFAVGRSTLRALPVAIHLLSEDIDWFSEEASWRPEESWRSTFRARREPTEANPTVVNRPRIRRCSMSSRTSCETVSFLPPTTATRTPRRRGRENAREKKKCAFRASDFSSRTATETLRPSTPSCNTPTTTSRPRPAPGPPAAAKAAKARRVPLAPLVTKILRTNDLRFTTFLSRQARCWCGCTDSTSTTPTAPYQTQPPSSSHHRGSRRQTNLSTSKPPDDPRDRWQVLRACRRGPGTPGSWRGYGGRTRETGLMAGVAVVVGECGSILSAVLHGKAGRVQQQSGEAKAEIMRRRTTYRERLRCL